MSKNKVKKGQSIKSSLIDLANQINSNKKGKSMINDVMINDIMVNDKISNDIKTDYKLMSKYLAENILDKKILKANAFLINSKVSKSNDYTKNILKSVNGKMINWANKMLGIVKTQKTK